MRKTYYKLPFCRTIKQLACRLSKYGIGKTPKIRTDIYSNRKHKLEISNPFKISVVIPNYNYEKYIIERIDSILFQTYPIYELIILDDCSTDRSVEIIQEKIKDLTTDFPIRLICNEKIVVMFLHNGKEHSKKLKEIMYGLLKLTTAVMHNF